MAKDFVNYTKLEQLSLGDRIVDLREKGMKLGEEAGEFQRAMLRFVGAKNTSKSAHSGDIRLNVLEELCDTIIVSIDIINAVGFSDEEAADMFEKKLNKWKSKQEKY
jgi:hypothetical protein